MIDCREFVGIPYKERGRGKDGVDCLGLNLMVSRSLGYDVPDWIYLDEKANRDKEVVRLGKEGLNAVRLEEPVEGCYIEFSCMDRFHTGVYVGEGMFIHASKADGMVVLERLERWRRRVRGYYNVHHKHIQKRL